jgi:hypothetical protein
MDDLSGLVFVLVVVYVVMTALENFGIGVF